MRVLLFGTGRFYLNRKKYIEQYNKLVDVIGFIDNNADELSVFEGKTVYLPENIINLQWDAVVIMSVSYEEMNSQLITLGVPFDKILCWEAFYAYLNGEDTLNFFSCNINNEYKLRLLLVAKSLEFDGSSMAILYAAKELSQRGNAVTLLVPYCDERLRDDLLLYGICVKVNPSLRFLKSERYKEFINYDVAIVNVFTNIRLACELSRYMPTLWWIHENGRKFDDAYSRTQLIFNEYNNIKLFSRIRIVSVTNRAARVFEEYYPNRIDSVLPLGIPDEYGKLYKTCIDGKVSFAIIGRVEVRKAQDILLDAIALLPYEVRNKARFVIIGAHDDSDYYVKNVKKRAVELPSVVFVGVLDRESLKRELEDIDVIVCSSYEETLSIAIVEGMMNSKICITTEATGISDFMQDGIDGFIVRAGDAEALAEKIEYVINNISNLDDMRNAARKVYDYNFSMKIFGDRLEYEIDRTIDEYKI